MAALFDIFRLERVPEPEVMDAAEEVEAYANATAQSYLEQIDRTFVEHLALLLPPDQAFSLLDVGCGPGQIPIMIGQRWPNARITGIDAAPHMVEEARQNAQAAGVKNVNFETFRVSRDQAENRLPFAEASFDEVTCNSVVHHLSDPVAALNEIARVAKPAGAVLIRDLRRPGKLAVAVHLAWNGRHYSGQMKRLYEASVRAAYTRTEMQALLSASRLSDGRSRVFQHERTHLGIERSAICLQV